MFALRVPKCLLGGVLMFACFAPFANVTHGAEVLLSGFETDLSTSIPGVSWVAGTSLTTQVVSGIIGTSEGSSVLEIQHPESWSGDNIFKLDGPAVAEAISKSTALKFDLIAPQDFAWRQAFVIFQGSPVSWNSTQTQFNLEAGPETAYTVEFDLTQEFQDVNGVSRPLNEIALDAFDEETDWFQLVMVFQGPDNLPLGTSITYLDNVRLVQPDVGNDGDYNADGTVDAADYPAWRKIPSLFGGDPGGYNTWSENFGEGGAGGAAGFAASAVPEPGTFVLGMLAFALVSFNARLSFKAK
jgi:hypothetical protein